MRAFFYPNETLYVLRIADSFKKPDHISLFAGFLVLLAALLTDIFELKVASFLFFSFTVAYELYEIKKGHKDVLRVDHFTFLASFALIIISFVYYNEFILPIATLLMGFTLAYQIFRLKKMDLKRIQKKDRTKFKV